MLRARLFSALVHQSNSILSTHPPRPPFPLSLPSALCSSSETGRDAILPTPRCVGETCAFLRDLDSLVRLYTLCQGRVGWRAVPVGQAALGAGVPAVWCRRKYIACCRQRAHTFRCVIIYGARYVTSRMYVLRACAAHVRKLGIHVISSSFTHWSTYGCCYPHPTPHTHHLHTRMHTHTHTRACTNTHTLYLSHTHTYARTHACTHARMHAHMHAHTYSYMHTHTHARTHTHTHAHTRTFPDMDTEAPPPSTTLPAPSSQASAMPIKPLNLFPVGVADDLASGFLAVLQPEMLHVQRSIAELT